MRIRDFVAPFLAVAALIFALAWVGYGDVNYVEPTGAQSDLQLMTEDVGHWADLIRGD